MLLAAILRFWQLGIVPPSPDWDEVAIGYNAYSIMQTGKDEYGQTLPIILRSFDDYKPALYAYFVIPNILLFGLTVISVRFPAVIFSLLAILATFFLVKELFGKYKSAQINSDYLALTTSFLLAISPWHIQFSKVAFESNVGAAFNIFIVLSFLVGLRKPFFLIVAAGLASINLYIYQSEKVFTPLLVFTLMLLFRKEIFSIGKRYLVIAFLLGTLIVLPLISYTLTNKQALSRAQGVSVFADQTPFLKDNVEKIRRDRKSNDTLGLIIDNRRLEYVRAIVAGYISHFDLNWLFITGDLSRHHAPSMGLLYLFELPLLFIGIYALLFNKFDFKTKAIIFAWFLITPIPASITSGVPHSVRTLNFLPTFQIFTALGLITFFSSVSSMQFRILNFQIKYTIFIAFIIVSIFNFLYYLNQYFVQQNYFTSKDWQFGYKDTIEEVKKINNAYDKIIVSNKPPLDQSYMFFLFYLKYNPSSYQQQTSIASGGFRENHQYDKYEFRPIEWEKEDITSSLKTLYIGRPEDFPEGVKIIKIVSYLNGEQAIKIVER